MCFTDRYTSSSFRQLKAARQGKRMAATQVSAPAPSLIEPECHAVIYREGEKIRVFIFRYCEERGSLLVPESSLEGTCSFVADMAAKQGLAVRRHTSGPFRFIWFD